MRLKNIAAGKKKKIKEMIPVVMITEESAKEISQVFERELTDNIKLIHFTQLGVPEAEAVQCRYCTETGELMKEVSGFSAKIELETHDFAAEHDAARRYGVEMVPATLITTDSEKGVYFFGIPTGYEFNAFIDDIVDVSRGLTNLSPEIKEKLRSIDRDVHIKVFTTPT